MSPATKRTLSPYQALAADLSATSPVQVELVGYLSGDVDGSFV